MEVRSYKAVIVDAHPFIREAVKVVLNQERFEVVAETNNGVDAVQLTRQHEPHLLILDIGIPMLDGLEVISRIKSFKLNTKVVVLTSQSPAFYVQRCRKQGAVAFISKLNELDELRKTLAAVMSGYTVFPVLESDSVRQSDMECSDQELIQRLSDRELIVLQHLARGMSNLEIGEALILSNKTISAHKKRVLNKLNLKSQVDLAYFAKRNVLI